MVRYDVKFAYGLVGGDGGGFFLRSFVCECFACDYVFYDFINLSECSLVGKKKFSVVKELEREKEREICGRRCFDLVFRPFQFSFLVLLFADCTFFFVLFMLFFFLLLLLLLL